MDNGIATNRGFLLGALLAAAGACAGGGGLRLREITPETIPALEAERAARPDDPRVLARLGVAYLRAAQYDSARAVLEAAVEREPSNGLAAIYLGMTAETQGEFAVARAAYERYLAVARSRALGNTARGRLALLGRRLLEYEARQAIIAEATLAQTPPEPNTVAVMPFGYTGANEEIRPLSRGFAQLVITDLAKSRQVTVLERERIQAMVDELRLAEQGQVTPETAARSGRLLRAARVVQGSLTDIEDDLRADAAVVDVQTAGVAATADARDALRRLFDIEKQLVFAIFANLGIELTDAERAEINRRPTQNLQAFLAYSRGLEAQDRGDFAAAAQFYTQAARLDPSFQAAQQGAAASADLEAAAQQTVGDVDAQATREERVETGQQADPETVRSAVQEAASTVTPPSNAVDEAQRTGQQPSTQKETQAESSGTEGVRPPTGRIIITIVRP
jgi:TolB-like protein